MSPESERDLKRLIKTIEETRSNWKVTLILEGIALAAAFFFAGIVIVFGFDNLFGNAIRTYGASHGMRWLDPLVRILLLLSLGGGLAFVFVRYLIGPAMRRFSIDRTAIAIEKAFPDLDNRLVNAVQLSRDKSLDGFSLAVVDAVIHDAARNVENKPVREKAVPKRRLKKLAMAAGIAFVVIVLYAGIGHAHFFNALKRYAMPTSDVATLSATRLKVSPRGGEVLAGESLTITAEVKGTVPPYAEIEITEKGRETRSDRMEFDGSAFSYVIRHVDADFSYRVSGGDAVSPRYHIKVKTIPTITRLEAEVQFPDYTGREPLNIREVPNTLSVLPRTQVTFTAHVNKPLQRGWLKLGDGKSVTADIVNDSILVATYPVGKTKQYWFHMIDKDNCVPAEPTKRTLAVVEDKPPAIMITSPKAHEERTPNGKLAINIRLIDDFGLRRARIEVRHSSDRSRRFVLKSWDITPGQQKLFPAHVWHLEESKVRPGDVFEYFVAVSDNRNPEVVSPRMRVEIISPEKREGKSLDAIRTLYQDLTRLLKTQQQLYRSTKSFSDSLMRRKMSASRISRRQDELSNGQKSVRKEGDRIAGTVKGLSRTEKAVKAKLSSLVANEMLAAIKAFEPIAAATKSADKARSLGEVAKIQTEIIDGIRAILDELRKGYQNLQDEDAKRAEFAEVDPRDLDKAKKLERAKRTLEKFIEEQRKVIKATEELEQKDVEDFTEEDRRKLEDLIQKERELARTMTDLKDDLSRLPTADQSDGTQVEEKLEIYVDVKLMNAADALALENIELAVTNEEAGVEEAEELVKNIERWLSDHRDNIKWTMEDPPDEQEPPLADLPEELEDLIGELMEDEEELTEDVEDETSKWGDSLDYGAGWETSDSFRTRTKSAAAAAKAAPGNRTGRWSRTRRPARAAARRRHASPPIPTRRGRSTISRKSRRPARRAAGRKAVSAVKDCTASRRRRRRRP
jgi:hypothetical protein